MKRLAMLLGMTMAFGGCAAQSQSETAELRAAVPTRSELSMQLPDGMTDDGGRTAAIGERAEYYEVARKTSSDVNGLMWVLLQVVETIMEFPPTATEDGYAAWGPWSEALDPKEYVFFVERLKPGQFNYVLRARPRGEGDDAYVDILAGQSEVTEEVKKGALGLDFTAANALDPVASPEKGSVGFAYEVSLLDNTREIVASFEAFQESDAHTPGNAVYQYSEAADQSGSFVFGVVGDIEDNGSAAESLIVTTRWTPSGSGRGDSVATGGDLGALVVFVNECWDDSFNRVWYQANNGLFGEEGDETTCVFNTPLYDHLDGEESEEPNANEGMDEDAMDEGAE